MSKIQLKTIGGKNMSNSSCNQESNGFSNVWCGDEKKLIFQYFIFNDLRIRNQKLKMKERFKKMKGNK